MSGYSFLNEKLSKKTSILGLSLWVVIGISVGAAIVLLLLIISLWLTSKYNKNKSLVQLHHQKIPNVTKEIQEIRIDKVLTPETYIVTREETPLVNNNDNSNNKVHFEIGKDRKITYSGGGGGGGGGGGCSSSETWSSNQMTSNLTVPEVSHLGWGRWFTLRELQECTNGFADENVVGEGGYGVVYRGVMEGGIEVGVKNLMNNRGQAEKEFKVEVEAIGRVRHKNLVRLLGYCAEGVHRMLVYEYVDNGNLEQWLHGDVGPESPLTWENRMNIILGTAKGRPAGEVNLVEWLKTMVTNRNAEKLLDPRLVEKPSSRALKRVLLVALRCVDPNSQKRPKMGQVVHMLEADEFPFRDERRGVREHGRSHAKDGLAVSESGESSGYDTSSIQTTRPIWRNQNAQDLQ
ncbi:hypothetical protein ACFE04_004718 [Oxalis oulophora]